MGSQDSTPQEAALVMACPERMVLAGKARGAGEGTTVRLSDTSYMKLIHTGANLGRDQLILALKLLLCQFNISPSAN